VSGRAAKASRRQEREVLVERIVQAHDALHKEDVDAAHEQLHAAMGMDRPLSVDPLADGERFDKAFRQLCAAHGVQAMYVRAFGVPDERGVRLVSGGDGALCGLVDAAVRKETAA
jgi:hypothetical protein